MKFRQYKSKVFMTFYVATMFVVVSTLFAVWAFNYEVNVDREVVGYYEREGSSYYIYLDSLGVLNKEIDKTDVDYFKSKVGETVTVKAPSSPLVVISFMTFLVSVFWWINVMIEEHDTLSFSK